MPAPQMIALINHVAAVIGLAGGGAWTVRASAKPVCWMVVAVIALIKADRKDVAELAKSLSPWHEK
jgi:hypothetical protein